MFFKFVAALPLGVKSALRDVSKRHRGPSVPSHCSHSFSRVKTTLVSWVAAYISTHVALFLAILPAADWRWCILHVISA